MIICQHFFIDNMNPICNYGFNNERLNGFDAMFTPAQHKRRRQQQILNSHLKVGKKETMSDNSIDMGNGMMEVTARNPKTNTEATISYEMPNTIAGLTEKFGEEEVVKAATSQFVVKLQAAMRRALETGRDPQELTAWKPGVVFGGGSENPMSAVIRNLNKLSADQKRELLAQLNILG